MKHEFLDWFILSGQVAMAYVFLVLWVPAYYEIGDWRWFPALICGSILMACVILMIVSRVREK